MQPENSGDAQYGNRGRTTTRTEKDGEEDGIDNEAIIIDNANAEHPSSHNNTSTSQDDFLQTPFGKLWLNPIVLFILSAMVLVALLAPILLSSSRAVDILVLLALLPAIFLGVYVYIFKRDIVDPRQIYVRFCLSFLLLTPACLAAAALTFSVAVIIYTITTVWWLPTTVFTITVVILAVLLFVGTGDVGKYGVISRFDRYDQMTSPWHYTFYSCAVAMGMATFEVFYLVLMLRHASDAATQWSQTHPVMTDDPTTPEARLSPAPPRSAAAVEAEMLNVGDVILLMVFLAVLVGPMHLLGSYLMGLGVARVQVLKHDITPLPLLVATTLVRATFVCAFLFLPPFFRLGVAVVFFFGFALAVKRYERNMPQEYLRRTGYISFIGYGLLRNDEEDEQQDQQQQHGAGGGNVAAAQRQQQHGGGGLRTHHPSSRGRRVHFDSGPSQQQRRVADDTTTAVDQELAERRTSSPPRDEAVPVEHQQRNEVHTSAFPQMPMPVVVVVVPSSPPPPMLSPVSSGPTTSTASAATAGAAAAASIVPPMTSLKSVESRDLDEDDL